MNLGQIWAETGRLLSDPNNDRWSQSVLTIRANIAQTKIQGYTNAVKTQEQVTPVANVAAISVNAKTMDIVRVSRTRSDGSIVPFDGITREKIDFLYPNWQQWQAGEPRYWMYDATLQQIILAPAPDAANAVANGITLWESRVPADLSLSTDVPFDSNNQMIPYHIALCYWMAGECWADDGSPESLAKSKFYMSGSILNPGLYEKELGRIMSEFDEIEIIPEQILYRPEGGRTGSWWMPNKSNPLPFN